MSLNLQNTLNFAAPFIQYSPLTAGLGMEPAVSIASMIRNSILNPPLTWYFNRAETTFSTVVGQQDYTEAIPDLAFIEKAALTDDQGNTVEIDDVYNNTALSLSAFEQRPTAISVESSSFIAGALNFKFRFLGVPDRIYLVTVVYQKTAPQFGPFFISSAANAAAGNTTYTGTFDVTSFPTGAIAIVTGFVTHVVNNGSFAVVSVTPTSLVLANAAGVAETIPAYVSNFSWDPIPDQYSDIYNNLFLSEAMAMVDDPRSQTYRQRGVAAFLSKASGLTEMQKNAFAQQWISRDVQRQASSGAVALGHAGRGV
jgi:hypothetical protein